MFTIPMNISVSYQKYGVLYTNPMGRYKSELTGYFSFRFLLGRGEAINRVSSTWICCRMYVLARSTLLS